MHQKALKAPKSTKVQKAQPSKNTKMQIREQKFKMHLKNIRVEKSNLFAYLHFCVFSSHEERKIEN